jgi:hypothetical protein
MTTSTNKPTATSANGQEVERLRAYLTAIADGAHGRASHTWIKGMADGALRGDPILVGDMGNLRRIPAEHSDSSPALASFCKTTPCLPESPCQHSHECYGSQASGGTVDG